MGDCGKITHIRYMRELERNLKALANRRRLAILKYIKERKEATVGEISDKINLSFRSTSKHLAVLAACDILEKEQRSSQVYYKFASKHTVAVRHIISLL